MSEINEILKRYAATFKYKRLDSDPSCTLSYIKRVNAGFVVLESQKSSKYVSFHLNNQTKIFKKSDLLLCSMEKIPAGWEDENE